MKSGTEKEKHVMREKNQRRFLFAHYKEPRFKGPEPKPGGPCGSTGHISSREEVSQDSIVIQGGGENVPGGSKQPAGQSQPPR